MALAGRPPGDSSLAMLLGVAVRLLVGGFFTLLVPGMVSNIPSYLLAVAAGRRVPALALLKPVREGYSSACLVALTFAADRPSPLWRMLLVW